jgi:hypothetical protein
LNRQDAKRKKSLFTLHGGQGIAKTPRPPRKAKTRIEIQEARRANKSPLGYCAVMGVASDVRVFLVLPGHKQKL